VADNPAYQGSFICPRCGMTSRKPNDVAVPSLEQAKAAVEYLLSEDENAQHRTGHKLLSVHGAAMLDLIRRYVETSPDEQFGDAS
jgi:hypothetical protein